MRDPAERRCALLAAVAIGLLTGLLAVRALAEPARPGRVDQSAYLNLGVATRGGAFPCDGVRAPLYPLLLAPFAGLPPDAYLAAARVLSAVTAAATVGVAAALAARLAGGVAGAIAALALAVSPDHAGIGALAVGEPLLALLCSLVGLAAVRGRWAAAGALLGLAYLAKTSAILFVPGLVLLAAREAGVRGAARALGAWALAASPLLLHHLVVHGTPFWSIASRHYMWLDSWGDHWGGVHPTFRSYVETHTAADALARLARGLAHYARADAPLLLGAALALGGLALRRPSREARRLAALVFAALPLFLLFFAWFTTRSPRYLFPLRPVVWALAALPVGLLGPVARRAAALGAPIVGAATVVLAVWPFVLSPPRSVPAPLHPDIRAVLDWRASSGRAWAEVVYDAHDDFLPGAWYEPTPGLLPMPAAPLAARPQEAEGGGACLVVTRHALLARQAHLAPWIEFGAIEAGAPVVVRAAPPGWWIEVSRPSVAVLCRR